MKPIDKICPGRIKKMEDGFCVVCNNEIDGFRDNLSIKEWTISGLCQKCQDSVFEDIDE